MSHGMHAQLAGKPEIFLGFFPTGFGRKAQDLLFFVFLVVQSGSRVPNRSLVSGQGAGGGGGGELASRGKAAARAWPCCDSCGGCTKSEPPRCQCLDAVPRGCHPACRNCLMFTTSGSVREPPVYRCADFLYNYCERRCTPEPDVV